MVHGEGLVYSRSSLILEAGVAAQEGPGCPGALGLPACMGSGPWPCTQGLRLGLGRAFPLLG